MSESKYVELTDQNFQEEAKDFDGVVVVDFWAEWCGPCKAIAPFIEKLAQSHTGESNVKVGKLDTDSNKQVAMEYKIMSIPSVKFLIKGEVVEELNGFMGPATADELEDKLQTALSKLG